MILEDGDDTCIDEIGEHGSHYEFIRGIRLHFIPKSYKGKQALYEGITFEKEKE